MKITRKWVLEQAITSEEVKKVLMQIYPEYFEEYFDLYSLRNQDLLKVEVDLKLQEIVGGTMNYFMHVRNSGEYENKGFYLPPTVNWEIHEEPLGNQVLVPKRWNEWE